MCTSGGKYYLLSTRPLNILNYSGIDHLQKTCTRVVCLFFNIFFLKIYLHLNMNILVHWHYAKLILHIFFHSPIDGTCWPKPASILSSPCKKTRIAFSSSIIILIWLLSRHRYKNKGDYSRNESFCVETRIKQ